MAASSSEQALAAGGFLSKLMTKLHNTAIQPALLDAAFNYGILNTRYGKVTSVRKFCPAGTKYVLAVKISDVLYLPLAVMQEPKYAAVLRTVKIYSNGASREAFFERLMADDSFNAFAEQIMLGIKEDPDVQGGFVFSRTVEEEGLHLRNFELCWGSEWLGAPIIIGMVADLLEFKSGTIAIQDKKAEDDRALRERLLNTRRNLIFTKEQADVLLRYLEDPALSASFGFQDAGLSNAEVKQALQSPERLVQVSAEGLKAVEEADRLRDGVKSLVSSCTHAIFHGIATLYVRSTTTTTYPKTYSSELVQALCQVNGQLVPSWKSRIDRNFDFEVYGDIAQLRARIGNTKELVYDVPKMISSMNLSDEDLKAWEDAAKTPQDQQEESIAKLRKSMRESRSGVNRGSPY